jgi:hypothetical protein
MPPIASTVPPVKRFGSTKYCKVAPIRDPGLDREQTNMNVFPACYDKEGEKQVVIVTKEGRTGEREALGEPRPVL